MSKFILAVAVSVLSVATVSAQIKSGSQPKDLVMASGSNGNSPVATRARVLGADPTGENKMNDRLMGPSPSSSLNHSSANNVNSIPTADNATATASLDSTTSTRSRTGITSGTAGSASTALSQIYRIGVGDVLDVQLIGVPVGKSTLFTVLEGGVLDYPLSNAPVPVAGLTAEEVAAQLRARIKVLDNPRVVVRVRDYSSHNVIVTGLVYDPGARFLRREATPLYVVLAEAQPRSEAISATIMRRGAPILNVDLRDHNASATLVMPGDLIKVSGPPPEPIAFFYAGGALNAPGQKPFHSGLTLTQAILASGGLTRAAGGKVKVSRQGADGRLVTAEYNLRQIEDGKIQDPALQTGDRIAVAENH